MGAPFEKNIYFMGGWGRVYRNKSTVRSSSPQSNRLNDISFSSIVSYQAHGVLLISKKAVIQIPCVKVNSPLIVLGIKTLVA